MADPRSREASGERHVQEDGDGSRRAGRRRGRGHGPSARLGADQDHRDHRAVRARRRIGPDGPHAAGRHTEEQPEQAVGRRREQAGRRRRRGDDGDTRRERRPAQADHHVERALHDPALVEAAGELARLHTHRHAGAGRIPAVDLHRRAVQDGGGLHGRRQDGQSPAQDRRQRLEARGPPHHGRARTGGRRQDHLHPLHRRRPDLGATGGQAHRGIDGEPVRGDRQLARRQRPPALRAVGSAHGLHRQDHRRHGLERRAHLRRAGRQAHLQHAARHVHAGQGIPGAAGLLRRPVQAGARNAGVEGLRRAQRAAARLPRRRRVRRVPDAGRAPHARPAPGRVPRAVTRPGAG